MSRLEKDVPICIHAHQLNIPLLADFPKNRIDVNPFWESSFVDGKWGTYSLRNLCAKYSRYEPILLFLDSYTVQNISIIDIEEFDGDVYLFLGDTQHGPISGFRKLQEIARSRCVKKIYFVNNPQHAHWFADTPSDFERFFYLPIGLANYKKQSTWETRHTVDKVVHVGNVLPTHLYRKYIIDEIKKSGFPITVLRTQGYKAANSIHSLAKASLNISLNSDLSFRLSEIFVSGGVCISDSLGFIQRANCAYLNSNNLIEFNDISSLASIMTELMRGGIDIKPANYSDIYSDTRLNSLDDLVHFSRPVIDQRKVYWRSTGGARKAALQVYMDARDACISNIHPQLDLIIDSADSFDRFLDVIDLPRLRILARCSRSYAEIIKNIVSDFNINKFVSIISLKCN